MNEIKVISDVLGCITWDRDDHIEGQVSILINGRLHTLNYTLNNNKTAHKSSDSYKQRGSENSDLYLEITKISNKEKREGYVNKADNFGETPLHFAARIGDLDMIVLLVYNGGDVTMKNDTNSNTLILINIE